MFSLSCEALAKWDKIIRIMKNIFKGLGLGVVTLRSCFGEWGQVQLERRQLML